MRKIMISVLVVLMVLVCFGFISSVKAQDIPQYTDKYVNDFGGVLDHSSSAMLRGLFYDVDMNTTAEVVFVSFDTIGTESISDYATRIGQTWGVGKSNKDNGIVILYVKDINKIWVATGYGVEGILPDSKVGRLLDDYYVPQRDSGNVSQGIVDFSVALSDVLYTNRDEILSGKASPKDVGSQVDVGVIIFIIVIVVIVLKIIARSKYGKKPRSSWPWFVPLFIPMGRSNSGFGGGGFGGGGFGGGGFGGGGAGR